MSRYYESDTKISNIQFLQHPRPTYQQNYNSLYLFQVLSYDMTKKCLLKLKKPLENTHHNKLSLYFLLNKVIQIYHSL